MPNVYKEKECPTCGTKHRKQGPYCSRSCGNIRTFTPEEKQHRSNKLHEYYDTPEGIATKHLNARRLTNLRKEQSGEYVLTEDDYMLGINLPEGYEPQDDDDGWEVVTNW